jgi:hypothetical protein
MVVQRSLGNALQELVHKANEQITSHCQSLVAATGTTAELQERVRDLRLMVESTSADIDQKRRVFKVTSGTLYLRRNLKNLERSQQSVAFAQQMFAKNKVKEEVEKTEPDVAIIERFNRHLFAALTHSGTSLIGALVIGFDMESVGLATALARVFPRVGAINFSSHFADYENPFQVLNSSGFLFNAVVPADALARENLVDKNLPEELQEEKGKITVAEKVMKHMIEVWKENYIAVKRKDEVENLKKAEDLNIFKTNYVVIGPVSSSLQISTVNEILNQHKVYLSYHAVVLTLRPLRVGGTTMKFKMYRPPPQ